MINEFNPYLIEYNIAFFESDLLKIQVYPTKELKDIKPKIFIGDVETKRIGGENFIFEVKKLGKDSPLKLDFKIVFESNK